MLLVLTSNEYPQHMFSGRNKKYEGCSKWIAYFYLETSNFKLAQKYSFHALEVLPVARNAKFQPMYPLLEGVMVRSGLPLSGRTAYITPWDCHRTSKLNFKDVPRTSEISFVRPKSIPEMSKNCQKARPLLTSCMMFAPPTYRKFATCVGWALRTSHLREFYWQPCQASRHPFDGYVITACICHACWVD